MNPEQLLVLAAASCQLLSFLAVAARARLDVVSYEDDATGFMPEDDRPVRLTRIELHPQIRIANDYDEAAVLRLVDLAHKECYIANSLTTEVVVLATVKSSNGATMVSEEHAGMVRDAYQAFSGGDIGVLAPMFAEDAVWHVSGTGGLSGVKRGRDQILGYFGELVARSGATLRLDLHDVVAGPDHTVGLHHNHAEREGRHLDQNVVLVVHVREGTFTEVWEFHEDQTQYDEFWR